MIENTERGYSATCDKCDEIRHFGGESETYTLEECLERAEFWGYRNIDNKLECPGRISSKISRSSA